MSSPFLHSFSGRKVFLTGHTGFKGSWLTLWLHRLGAEVTGYALEPPTDPNNFTVSGIHELLARHHEADIRDERTLHAALLDAAPDVVFHLAAQSVVIRSYRIPRETFDVNVIGTAVLLDGLRKLEKPCSVVIVTSDKCYRNDERDQGYRECDAMGDYTPYGGSKGATELLVRSYRHSFFHPSRLAEHGIKIATGRSGNVIGGGDWTEDALVADMVRALSRGEPVKVRNPGARRPWQHVLQALSGYLTLAARMSESDDSDLCGGWNIGPLPGGELTVREMVERFLQEWGDGSYREAPDPDQPYEAGVLSLAIEKALEQLHWRPHWDVDEALRQTARWYRRYFDGGDVPAMRALGIAQIEEYERALSGGEGS